jgi:methionyl-tRNA formyltransferase
MMAQKEGLKLFNEFIDQVQQGRQFTLNKLDQRHSTYFPRLYTQKHGFINWSWNGREINDFIYAFDDPYEGASTFLNNQPVHLKSSTITLAEGKFHPFFSGLVYRISNKSVYIAVKDGTIIIQKVILGKKNIINQIRVGQRFYTPIKYLEEAMTFEAKYDSRGLVTDT